MIGTDSQLPKTKRKAYHAYGAAAELFKSCDPEVLIEGPAGTGKTRAILEKVYALAQYYGGMRGVLVRKTKTSMTQTILVTWERYILQPGDGVKFSDRRQSYLFPNGSEIMLGGLDDQDAVQRFMSAELDLIAAFEATELRESDWETLTTRLRNQSCMPFKQAIADCNPERPSHWLNQRCNQGRMKRLKSRHADNPSVTNQYLDTLRRLTGVKRLRLYEGKWAAAEGMVYEAWDPDVHVIPASKSANIQIRRSIGSCDWGFRNPGVIQCWGLDGEHNMYLIEEHYHTGKSIEWWVEKALEFRDKHRCDLWAPDPEDPEKVEKFRRAGLNCVIPNKAIELGLDLVRQRLAHDENRKPTLYLLENALAQRDESLVEAGKPFCTQQEFENYLYPKGVDGKPIKEVPEDENNHGMDAMRYGVWLVDRGVSVEVPSAPAPKYRRGTLGAIADHHLIDEIEVEEHDPFA